MFNDPALVFAFDLPMGWCIDMESSLLRLVLRPWDRLDERIVLTAVPIAALPTDADDAWAEAAAKTWLGFAASSSVPVIPAARFGLTMMLGTRESRMYRRVILRGAALDLVADHLCSAGSLNDLAPAMVRIVSTARSPVSRHSVTTSLLEEAKATAEALIKHFKETDRDAARR